jgi:disulfide bond formation protein DsbB
MMFASSPPNFTSQIRSGFGIFAIVLIVSLPLAFVSQRLALAVAVAVGSVFLALLARRLRIALLLATLLAMLGAIGAAHSVHLYREPSPSSLAQLAPAAGAVPGTRAAKAVIPTTSRVSSAHANGVRTEILGWLFPGALFTLWAIGLAAVTLNRAVLRWIRRVLP